MSENKCDRYFSELTLQQGNVREAVADVMQHVLSKATTLYLSLA